MPTILDARQVEKRQALARLGVAANDTVSTVLDQVNTEFNSPLRLFATATPNAVLNFSSSLISAADTAKKIVSPVKKQIFSGLVNPTINFQTQALSNAADFDVTWPVSTVGRFRYAGFTLIGSGKIKVLFSAEALTEGALTNPGALFVTGGLPIGYVALEATATTPAFKTAGSVTNIIENLKIFRFGSGGGSSASGTGNGTGAEIQDLRFRAEIQDSFQDIPSLETPVDIATNKTDPLNHDVANELFRFSYDASKTVTGTGTAMSLSTFPTFTVKIGDVLVVGSEVREITVLGSINSTGAGFTIASAFTTNPAAAAANVSQAVYTKDLNSFDANGTGFAVSSQITDNVSVVLVNYEDSSTLADIIPDWGAGPHVAYHITANNTTWGNRKIREVSLNGTAVSASVPVSGTQFRIRFFANKTTGSGAVNLLSYKAFWHEQIAEGSGATYNTAFARILSSDFVNVSHSVVALKSRFTFTFSYGRGLNPTQPAGSALEVYANGQLVPRYSAGVTDDTQAYFTEVTDSIIDMDGDYSAEIIDFQFKVPVTVIDSATTNTGRIATLESLLPAGIIMEWGGDTDPSGWFIIDGRAISRTGFSSLFANIGTRYGVGDGSTTFNIPDRRGVTPRADVRVSTVTGSGSSVSNNATFTANNINRTGFKVRLQSGALTGLAVSTTYFAIVVDANTLAFATTYANAIAGTKIVISGVNTAILVQYESPDSATRLQAAVGGNTSGTGTREADQLLSHTHTSPVFNTHSGANVQIGTAQGTNLGNLSVSFTGGNETRMTNVATNYIIKY